MLTSNECLFVLSNTKRRNMSPYPCSSQAITDPASDEASAQDYKATRKENQSR